MVMGAWVSQTISAITRLDIPDLLHQHGSRTAAQLTQDHGVDAEPEFLERALRACASLGIFTEEDAGRFGATALSEPLTSGSLVSVKKITEIMGASWWKVWTGLADGLRTGESQAKAQLGMEYWDYCKANPKEMEDFGEAMKSNSNASMQGVLEHCNLSGVSKVVDIGGGFGHLAVELLRKYEGLNAQVLDMPELVPIAKERLRDEDPTVVSRLEFVGGDMFEDVPAANVYVMKHIIHDWNDAQCTQLLQNCHERMEGDGSVISVDAVLPPIGNVGGTPAKLMDVNMLVFIPGKERTLEQWEALYESAGFKITSTTPLHDNFGTSIVEGKKL